MKAQRIFPVRWWSARVLIAIGSCIVLPGSDCLSAANPAQQSRQVKERRASLSPESRERVRQVIPAVGLVLVRNLSDAAPDPRPRGSAVVVRKDGIVITNFHVIANDRNALIYDELYLQLPQSGKPRRYRLRPLLLEKSRDLALLRIVIEGSDKTPTETVAFPAIEMGDSRTLELLDDLIIIGFPEKGGITVTANPGVVEGRDDAEEWIKTDARLIHGNSGGAAVNPDGKLIGIPTKVVVDGDAARAYGAVGFLRPAHLVAGMLQQLEETEKQMNNAGTAAATEPVQTEKINPDSPDPAEQNLVAVSGIVQSEVDDKPIAGVRVGLLPIGQEVTAASLLAWGGTNASGKFELGRKVPPGRYTLRARVIGYDPYAEDVEISAAGKPLIIRLHPSAR